MNSVDTAFNFGDMFFFVCIVSDVFSDVNNNIESIDSKFAANPLNYEVDKDAEWIEKTAKDLLKDLDNF